MEGLVGEPSPRPHLGYTRCLRPQSGCSCKLGGPFLECPYKNRPTILGSILGPLIFGNSQITQIRAPGGLVLPVRAAHPGGVLALSQGSLRYVGLKLP